MADTPARTTLRLENLPAGSKGRALCLRPGDLLIAVNGTAFHGTVADLAKRLSGRPGHHAALTFLRGDHDLTVLVDSADLGRWEEVAANAASPTSRLNPDVLRNWEFVKNKSDVYDIQPLAPGVLALLAPPIWLFQMRLWVPGAALIAAAMVAGTVSPFMLLAVYLAAGLHIWHAGPRYFRKDRAGRGMEPHMVLAAPSEKAAHAAYARMLPAAQFVFSAPKAIARAPEEEHPA